MWLISLPQDENPTYRLQYPRVPPVVCVPQVEKHWPRSSKIRWCAQVVRLLTNN